MSSKEFRKKSRTEMAKEHTEPVKVGKFIVSSHAQNRMVQRDIPNEAMIRNLVKKPLAISKIEIDSKGRPSYKRHNHETTVYINPNNKNATSIHEINKKDARKNGITHIRMIKQSEIDMKTASSKNTTIKPNKPKVNTNSNASKRKTTTVRRVK